MRKLFFSFFAALIGWAAGFVYYALYMTYFTPWGRPTDVPAILSWSAVFVFIAWLIFVLPVVYLVPSSSRIFSLPGAPAVGAAAGLGAFLLHAGWWTGFWTESLYRGYALVVGAATGLVYASLVHYPEG